MKKPRSIIADAMSRPSVKQWRIPPSGKARPADGVDDLGAGQAAVDDGREAELAGQARAVLGRRAPCSPGVEKS